MLVNGKPYRTIWVKNGNKKVIKIIDQRDLPYKFKIEELCSVDDVVIAIKDMHVRGAGLIGVAAAYGMYLATLEAVKTDSFQNHLLKSVDNLKSARPTAVNLSWAVDRQLKEINKVAKLNEKINMAYETANQIMKEDIVSCKKIGDFGMTVIENMSRKKKGKVINILTHCNAGWLAFVDYGTALSPVYSAFEKGISIHVWVDETRPRNQGSKLTAWELHQHNVPYTVIADNTGGYLMQQGLVDLVIVGADRVTFTGDAANKIGTYLKALAAKDNDVPFYVAFPSSTFDWNTKNGIKEIPIEERSNDEVLYMQGMNEGEIKNILIASPKSPAKNYAFDVTPARLITGFITERGICKASEKSISDLFPEHVTTN